jgi:hypothetical protein
VNVAVAPLTCQLPAILGESVGSGVTGESAAENVSVTGAPPLASWVAARGGDREQPQRAGRLGRR